MHCPMLKEGWKEAQGGREKSTCALFMTHHLALVRGVAAP